MRDRSSVRKFCEKNLMPLMCSTFPVERKKSGDDYWPLIMRRPRMLNAGVDVNNFEPVAFDELLANNKAFQCRHADTAKANPFALYCAEA